MEIGLLTAPLRGKTLDWIIEFAKKNGLTALEVVAGPGGGHLDTAKLTAAKAKQINAALKKAGVRISSLAYYDNLLEPDKAGRAATIKGMESVIDAAALLGIDVVCTLAGFPMPGKERTRTIAEDFPGVFRPLAKYAAKKKIKIAFENYFATNIRNLADWQQVFEVVPDANVGLNYDPSHLLWQGIDYLEAVEVQGSHFPHPRQGRRDQTARAAVARQPGRRLVAIRDPRLWRRELGRVYRAPAQRGVQRGAEHRARGWRVRRGGGVHRRAAVPGAVRVAGFCR